MSPDMTAVALISGIAAAVVLYIVGTNRHDLEQRERRNDQEQLWRNMQWELDRKETSSVRRHEELQRRLNQQERILEYLARRLS